MFEQLFRRTRTVARYLAAPLLVERLRYLQHWADEGASVDTLRRIAVHQVAAVRRLNLAGLGTITPTQVEAAATRWASRSPRFGHQKRSPQAGAVFTSIATRWLGFMGRLQAPEPAVPSWGDAVADFADCMRAERGLAASTIYTRRKRAEEFLRGVAPRRLRDLTMADVDRAIADKGTADHCTRASIRTYAYAVRSFLRHAEARGWCAAGLADGVLIPRVYAGEQVPMGPTWAQVQALCASVEGPSRAQILDRALLLLFAVYGLRVGEVRRLRLDDLDWEAECIRIRRFKQRPHVQVYPLRHSVGDAVLRYVKEVRPRSAHRSVFLSLRAPYHPLGNSAFWQRINRRLRPLNLALPHLGPHILRHACATRLLEQGMSMKTIADHLGHRNLATTSIYAKVDLRRLRQVADFSLEGLL
jgi:site-specific recombinase XerD